MIKATISRDDLKKMENHLVKNVKFATVRTFTETVKLLSSEIKDDLKRKYTVRNHWVVGSIKYTTASKRDARPTAEVGTIQPFMASHEVGGQRPQKEDQVGIPLWARRNPSMWTKPSTWPKAILRRDKATATNRKGQTWKNHIRYFVLTTRGHSFVVQRYKKSQKSGLRFWWMFKKHVKQKPDWGFKWFEKRALRMSQRLFPIMLDEALKA